MIMLCDNLQDVEEIPEYRCKHYDDRFWYERKHNNPASKLYYKVKSIYVEREDELAKKRPNAVNAGTQPDIKIRW